MTRAFRFLSGLGIGAAAMFIFDPQRGRARRARIHHKLTRLRHDAKHAANVTARDAANRLRGLRSQVRFSFNGEAVDDRTLVERVRSRLGHCSSHARFIDVAAHGGKITLGGAARPEEVDALLSCVRRVPGVHEVENLLAIDDDPSELQHERTGGDWAPSVRMLAGLAGVGLMAKCAIRRDAISMVLGAVGFGLALRAAANESVRDWVEQSIPLPDMKESPLLAVAAAGPVM